VNPTRCPLAALAAVVLAAGCSKTGADKSAPLPTTAPTVAEGRGAAVSPPRGAPPAPAGPAGGDLVAIGGDDKTRVIATAGKTIADRESHVIELAVPEKLPAGADGLVTVAIKPKGGWHLNVGQGFPTKLEVAGPTDVTVAGGKQAEADAAQWTEQAGRWEVRLKGSAPGKKDFAGKVKFGVCTETTCVPTTQELAFAVQIE
jgi:hypothetical protein